MQSVCRIQLFGGLTVYLRGETITRFRTQKAASLLAYLALHLSQTHSRERLIEVFWPEMEPEAARDNLSTALSSLRRMLEPPAQPLTASLLLADRLTVRLNSDIVTTDAAEFEEILRKASRLDGLGKAEALQSALHLYKGDFLPGNYDDWAVREQTRYTELYTSVLMELGEEQESANDLTGALETMNRVVQADPYLEEAYQAQMRLLHGLGRASAAIEVYDRLTAFLREQMGALPEPATRQLAQEIRQSADSKSPQLIARPKARSADKTKRTHERTELSLPQLTDNSHEKIGGWNRDDLPALPVQLTRFVGREEEQKRLAEWVTDPTVKLITLLGPGGTGKTRLSVEVARTNASHFGNRIWFVSLAEIPAPNLIPMTLAHALRLAVNSSGEPLEAVIEALSGAPALLILDNMEHLLREPGSLKGDGGIGGGNGADIVRVLLQRLPELKCLVSSRIALRLGGEQEFPLRPLALPLGEMKPEQLLQCESVALYVDRARLALPDFALTGNNVEAVATLCQKLEGMPLAIEMAAAWAKLLPPRKMLERMEQQLNLLVSRRKDLPPRHQSLRATIEWSYDLLTPELRELFANLSVFRGGWKLEMAEAICGTETVFGLEELLEHSLIVMEEENEEPRYRMLETLREFAREKLAERGDKRPFQSASQYFLELAERAEPHLHQKEGVRWLKTLEREMDNYRSLLDWCRKHHPEMGLRIVGALWRFWELRSHLVEGERWLSELLQKPENAKPSLARGQSLQGAGTLLLLQAEYPRARAYYEEALEVARTVGDRTREAAALHGLGNIHFYDQEYSEAQTFYEQALALREAEKDELGMGASFHSLGNVAMRQEKLDEARANFEKAVALRRKLGCVQTLAMSLGALGQLANMQEDFATALRLSAEAMRVFHECGLTWCITLCCNDVLSASMGMQQFDRAARLYAAMQRLREQSNYRVPPKEVDQQRERLEQIREALGEKEFERAWNEAAGWAVDQAVDYALATCE